MRLKTREEQVAGGNYVKTGVCNEHTEAAGTLKVKINNPI